MPLGVDYVVTGFDMEVQPLVTHNVVWPLYMSAIRIDVVSNHLLFAHMPWALLAYGVHNLFTSTVVSTVSTDIQQSYEILQNRIWYHKPNALQGTNEWMASDFMAF